MNKENAIKIVIIIAVALFSAFFVLYYYLRGANQLENPVKVNEAGVFENLNENDIETINKMNEVLNKKNNTVKVGSEEDKKNLEETSSALDRVLNEKGKTKDYLEDPATKYNGAQETIDAMDRILNNK